jgi:regulatory protein
MPTITAIESQTRDSDRVNIHLDGKYAFSLARILAAWLKTGQELDEKKILSLQTADAIEEAYRQAMLFLSFRTRSAAEVRQNLRKHKVPDDVIERTIERLQENKFVDDTRFARAWVENRSTFRPRGMRALKLELRQKGLSDETARSALVDLDEEALAYQAGQKKLRHFEHLEWDEFRKKLSDHLARRGFPYSIITSVVTRLWNETRAVQHMSDNEEFS